MVGHGESRAVVVAFGGQAIAGMEAMGVKLCSAVVGLQDDI